MTFVRKICSIVTVSVIIAVISNLIIYSTPQDSIYIPCFEKTGSVLKSENVDICKVKDDNAKIENHSTCLTSVCNASAASILEKMDVTVDPCDDFYKFACGSYVKNTVIPGDRSNENLFTMITDKVQAQVKSIVETPIASNEIKPVQYVKQFYNKCVNQLNSIESAKKVLNQIGNWPALKGEDWKSDEFDTNNVTYKLRQMGLPFDNMFRVYTNRLTKNATNEIFITYPTLSLPTEFLIDGPNNSVVKAYYDFIVNMSVALGAERTFAQKEFNDSMLFEIQLANLTNVLGTTKIYHLTTIVDLAALHPFIPWENYINHIIANENIKVRLNDTINIKGYYFIGELENLLKSTPKRIQANYILSRVLEAISPYLSEEIKNFELEYYKIAFGVTEKPIRWKECFNIFPNGLVTAISTMYIRNFSDISNIKLKAKEFANNLKSAFINIINESTWMNEKVKLKAVEKANSLIFNVGFSEELLNNDLLEKFYNDLTITPNDDSLEIFLKVNKFEKDKIFSTYGQAYDISLWVHHIEVTTLNVQYSRIMNAINVPAALLENTSYAIDRPEYMNYGGLGFVIGSCISQGFNDNGRQYDKNGVKNNWWQLSTKIEYDRKSECLIQQYSNIIDPKFDIQVDARRFLEDNIASNAAVRIAYMAYQHWVNKNGMEQILPGMNYTSNQLFWISSAQYMCSVETEEHLKQIILSDENTPSKFRVTGTFSNSEDFSKDFNCRKGSPMNPENKCRIW